MLRINNITIEGPDLSGKTTLFEALHKKTNYRWNIQDRSQLSMICYARQFNRGQEAVTLWRSRLDDFLFDLNNRLIVLLPCLSVINRRYELRGDEIQDMDSLYSLYEIFSDEVKRIEEHPNVLVLRGDGTEDLTNKCIGWCTSTENYELERVSTEVEKIVRVTPTWEISPLKFSMTFNNPEDLVDDHEIMTHPAEEVYYANIMHKVMKNIQDEIAGKNEYGVPQAIFTTRRFVFTQDSCISMIHTMVRGDSMTMNVVCRSSDVVKTFAYDLRFLAYLFGRVYKKITPKSVKNFSMKVTLNSAHIIQE
tara:strand:+ start:529 stop:1449 length:921 start_codon:yes stop_codon:yes gene_type:complete